jgi:hypothetical protein
MEITFGNMKIKLNVFNAFQYLPDASECFFLGIVEESVEDSLHLLIRNLLEACLTHFGFEDFDTEQYIGKVSSLLNTATTIDFPP